MQLPKLTFSYYSSLRAWWFGFWRYFQIFRKFSGIFPLVSGYFWLNLCNFPNWHLVITRVCERNGLVFDDISRFSGIYPPVSGYFWLNFCNCPNWLQVISMSLRVWWFGFTRYFRIFRNISWCIRIFLAKSMQFPKLKFSYYLSFSNVMVRF